MYDPTSYAEYFIMLKYSYHSFIHSLFTAKQLKRRNSKRRKKFPNLKNHHCQLALILKITLTMLHHGCLLANVAQVQLEVTATNLNQMMNTVPH